MAASARPAVDSSFDSSPRRTSANSGGRSGTLGRRGNREGSVYQRRDGRWVAAVSDASGGRTYRYARTRAEAAAKLTTALKTVADNLPLAPERQTVGDFLSGWLETTARPTVRPSTYVSYAGIVNHHLIPELGRIRLSWLSPQDVQEMLNRKLAEGLSPRRVDYLRGVLHRALNQALRWSLVGRNVAGLARSPKQVRYEIRPLSPPEVGRLLQEVRGDRLEALFTLAVATGMRRGELLGLGWADVDLHGGTIQVRHALERFDGAYRLVEPKSARGARSVSLPAFALESLQRHRQRQAEERGLAQSEWMEWGLVFATPIGLPLDGSMVTHALHRHLRRAGLRRQRFHDLRHACASLLLAEGVNPRVVMEILGHSQVSLTLNTYSHVIPSLGRDAADRLQSLLGAPDEHAGDLTAV
jgi:integrase